MNNDKISQLLDMAYTTESAERTASIARQILEISPDNTEALILTADTEEDPHSREEILLHARKSLDDPQNFSPDDKDGLTFSINYRLAYTYFTENRPEDSLVCCENALRVPDIDSDFGDDIKELYYRVLIDLEEWQSILSETLKDDSHSLAWAYSRLVAAWMTAPGKSQAVCANMFWDALSLAPDVPFYMLNYYDEPDDDDEHPEFDFALMYYDVLSLSDDFSGWFKRGTILFGLLTNRFDEREREYVIDALDSLGGLHEYERMSHIVIEGDDMAVIEILAANKCLSE